MMAPPPHPFPCSAHSSASVSPSVVTLTRTVRTCIDEGAGETGPVGIAYNSYSGHPSMVGAGRYFEVDVRCRGQVDAATGYFLNIKDIDRAVRGSGLPVLAAWVRDRPRDPASSIVGALCGAIGGALRGAGHRFTGLRVRLRLTPRYSVESQEPDREKSMSVLMRQQFEFAAAHRLHAASLSEEENRRLFGKCNNPRGHGHNYRVEPCVEVRSAGSGPAAGGVFTLQDLERLAAATIVERFDHTHLNEDTEEFNVSRGGVNPSVENIARVCYDLLAPVIAGTRTGATLRSVTVWETEKTSATYPAD